MKVVIIYASKPTQHVEIKSGLQGTFQLANGRILNLRGQYVDASDLSAALEKARPRKGETVLNAIALDQGGV